MSEDIQLASAVPSSEPAVTYHSEGSNQYGRRSRFGRDYFGDEVGGHANNGNQRNCLKNSADLESCAEGTEVRTSHVVLCRNAQSLRWFKEIEG
jgi:hypothetical protein